MRRLAMLATMALVVGAAGSTPVSLAVFAASRTSSATFTTLTLAPPTAASGATATLSWTQSVTAAATGYHLMRSTTSGSGYAQVKNVTPVSAATTTDAPGNGTWYYVLQTYLGTWTSANSNQATVALGPTSTGFKNCASNAADTGGDGNGYETTPANGCVQDGSYAQDANSGTGLSNLCLDAGNDRHRYWGYVLGLPASVASIDGITVQARMGTNNATGTYGACVQLSWDGGGTWTTHQPMTFLTNAQTTYTFGGAADTWGRTWTPGNLDTTMFRVRIIDVATVANKRFDLDWLGVSVNYTP